MQIRLVEIVHRRHAVAAENFPCLPAPVIGMAVEEAQVTVLVMTVRLEIGPVVVLRIKAWLPNGEWTSQSLPSSRRPFHQPLHVWIVR